MDKLYIVSIETIYEPEPIPTKEDFGDIVDDFSYESYEYFYNFENRIGFGSRPYSKDCVSKEYHTYGRLYAIIKQRVSILGHCKECAIEQVETWFREHQEIMGRQHGVCDAVLQKPQP